MEKLFSINTLMIAHGKSERNFRSACKLSSSALKKYQHKGLNWKLADRYAVRCNFHPIEIWGIEEWLALDDIN